MYLFFFVISLIWFVVPICFCSDYVNSLMKRIKVLPWWRQFLICLIVVGPFAFIILFLGLIARFFNWGFISLISSIMGNIEEKKDVNI